MASPDLAPRRAAVDILASILDRGAPLDAAFSNHAGFARLPRRDRAFARALVSTTLRRLGRIDQAIDAFLQRPLPATAGDARAILRAGAAQLLFLNTPAYAAVNAMTSLAGEMKGGRKFKRLVNAVLRRIAERGSGVIASMTAIDDWPIWLTEAWTGAYGAGVAARIAEASGMEAPLDITVKTDPDNWAQLLEADVVGPSTIRRLPGGDVRSFKGFKTGAWWVQDAAAALPVALLGDVTSKRVGDLCAAPGGKTLQLAAAGAHVTAVDKAQGRLKRLRENLERTSLSAEVVDADVLDWRPEEPFDAVLLDAPCTATGTLRRRPDVAWSKRPRDIAKLAVIQADLLKAAIDMVKPGGAVVFCTCSLQVEEGPDVVAAVIGSGAPIDLDPIGAETFAHLPDAIRSDGTLRTFPFFLGDSGGMDGFFAARLMRRQ